MATHKIPTSVDGCNARSISKKTRFEIFKRDGFACRYCGRHPPAVVLELDHIEPVVAGGGAEETNLLTACFDCNQGKGSRHLSQASPGLDERADKIREAEAQLAGYREVVADREARQDADAWVVIDELFSRQETTRANYQSVRRFLAQLDLDAVVDAARVARAWNGYSDPKRFRYFCGVCRRKIERLAECA